MAPRFTRINPPDPVAYICSANLHRRHLTTGQRAAIAAELANLPRGASVGNQHASKTKGPNEPFVFEEEPMSIDQDAALMKVSPSSVKRAKTILREARRLAIRNGGEIRAEVSAGVGGGGSG